jgi:hypothetical protein
MKQEFHDLVEERSQFRLKLDRSSARGGQVCPGAGLSTKQQQQQKNEVIGI